jgi:hypothetical protein
MKAKRTPFQPKAMLWWVAVIALAITGALFFFLQEQSQYDVALAQRRMLFPLLGIVIAGICAIIGTAERWFK